MNNTLHLKTPFGQTLALAFVLFILLVTIFESFVRTEFVSSHLNADIGSQHRQFETQLARLERYVKTEGSIDCIFIGSSTVWVDIDPKIFAQAYQEETGQDIRCYNFGVATMPASGAGVLGSVLVEDYHPKLLIYGTFARDYAIPRESRDASVILDTPWVQYRTGHFTVQGWLFTHFYSLRYLEPFRRLIRFDYAEVGVTTYEERGFGPKGGTRKDLEDEVADARKWLNNYQMWPENLAGLEQILTESENGVQVIVVETPVQQTFFDYFGNGKQDFEQFHKQIDSLVASKEIPFWQTTHLQLIPNEGWFDNSHLNIEGAQIFSEWLGHQVGKAVLQRVISNPTPE